MNKGLEHNLANTQVPSTEHASFCPSLMDRLAIQMARPYKPGQRKGFNQWAAEDKQSYLMYLVNALSASMPQSLAEGPDAVLCAKLDWVVNTLRTHYADGPKQQKYFITNSKGKRLIIDLPTQQAMGQNSAALWKKQVAEAWKGIIEDITTLHNHVQRRFEIGSESTDGLAARIQHACAQDMARNPALAQQFPKLYGFADTIILSATASAAHIAEHLDEAYKEDRAVLVKTNRGALEQESALLEILHEVRWAMAAEKIRDQIFAQLFTRSISSPLTVHTQGIDARAH